MCIIIKKMSLNVRGNLGGTMDAYFAQASRALNPLF